MHILYTRLYTNSKIGSIDVFNINDGINEDDATEWSLISQLPLSSLVAASVFYDLGGRRLLEDAGLVELQLFNALVDVAQGSKTESMLSRPALKEPADQNPRGGFRFHRLWTLFWSYFDE